MTSDIDTKIRWASIDELSLDPLNPRLGTETTNKGLDESELLDKMRDWELEELAVSFLESGFWPQEALIVVKSDPAQKGSLIVVEGNRRLAALKLLKLSMEGNPPSSTWREIAKGRTMNTKTKNLFDHVPYILAKNRLAITGFLGFRHVSGIKEWDPPEKAAFIAHMIDEQKLSYEQVMRRIGSKTEPVRRNYIAYRLLLQMEAHDGIDSRLVRERFSILFLALRGSGAQNYLGIDIEAPPASAATPVPKTKTTELANFTRWVFGSKTSGTTIDPIVPESRQITRFDKCLANASSRAYLERTPTPNLEDAYRIAGGEEFETYEALEIALTHLRRALGVIQEHRKSKRIQETVVKVSRATFELLRGYPEDRANLLDEEDQLNRQVRSRR